MDIKYILIISLFVIGCASKRPSGKTEAEVLYKESLELKQDGHYMLAMEKLNTLRSQYPYSYYATHAELLNADILFDQESFKEAASAYIIFRDFHPRHKKTPYVIWKIAESFYNQIPSTHDRDLTPGIEAIKYYQELLDIYPSAKYKKDAKNKIRICQEMLEKKDRYIADFYFKTEVYDAARYCYLDILKTFPSPYSPNLHAHAMLRVVESSLKLKKPADCKKYFNQFRPMAQPETLAKIKKIYEECTLL